MTWELYWLSILDSVKFGGGFLAIFVAVTGAVFLIYSLDGFQDSDENKRLRAWGKKLAIISFLLFLIAIFTPTKKDLIEAYMIKEGKKVATAENAEKAAKEVSEKVDKLIEALDKK